MRSSIPKKINYPMVPVGFHLVLLMFTARSIIFTSSSLVSAGNVYSAKKEIRMALLLAGSIRAVFHWVCYVLIISRSMIMAPLKRFAIRRKQILYSNLVLYLAAV